MTFGEKEGLVGGEGGASVDCETDVAGRLRHVGDVDGDDEKRRGRYEERVDFDCVSELDIEVRQRLCLFIYLRPALV